MNKAMQVRDAVVVVDRLELARAITVHLSGLLMNANAPLHPTAGADIESFSWLETTVDGEVTSEARSGAFRVERINIDAAGIEMVVLGRFVQLRSDHPDYEDFIVIHCEGGRMVPHVDQKLYTLPYDDTMAPLSIADFLA